VVAVAGRVITEQRVITPLLLSVDAAADSIQRCKRPTPSSLTPRGLAALHVQLISGIHSAHAFKLGYLFYFITTLYVANEAQVDTQTVHVC